MSTDPPRSLAADLRALLAIAGPIVLVQVGIMAMGVVDTIMIGRVSPAAIAAVSLGNTLVMAVGMFGMGVVMSLDAVVAQAVGAGDHPAIARSFQRALLLALLVTVPTTLLLLLGSEPLLVASGQPAEVAPLAVRYIWTYLPALPMFYLFIALRQTLQAMHRLSPIVWTMVLGNLLNWFLNWVLIYGHLGAPPLGVVGSALATMIGRYVMTIALLAVAWRTFGPLLRPFRREALALRPLLRFAALGVPIGTQFVLEVGVFAMVGLLMGRLGTTALAAHQIALNVASLTFMVPLGISMAAAVMVGRAVGAHDPAAMRRAARLSLGCAVAFMTLSALAMRFLAGPIARLYTPDAGVIAVAIVLLRLAAVFQVFDGIQVAAIGILRGIGDTRAPVVANVIGYWVLGLPLSLWLAFGLDLGPPGLWWGFVAGLAVVAVWMLSRVRAQMGRLQTRIVLDDGPSPSG
ncbi:MAG: MATE family efflux transporter [Candidatus Eisenbacteria bacterium]